MISGSYSMLSEIRRVSARATEVLPMPKAPFRSRIKIDQEWKACQTPWSSPGMNECVTGGEEQLLPAAAARAGWNDAPLHATRFSASPICR